MSISMLHREQKKLLAWRLYSLLGKYLRVDPWPACPWLGSVRGGRGHLSPRLAGQGPEFGMFELYVCVPSFVLCAGSFGEGACCLVSGRMPPGGYVQYW